MFDRSLVTSGFDTETLISEDYLTYLLLAQIEAGTLGLRFEFPHPTSGLPVRVQIHPPDDYVRRYEPHPDADPLPDPQHGSLAVRLLPEDDVAFLHLLAWITVQDETSGQSVGPVPAGMFIDLELRSTERNGLERNHLLHLALVGLDPTTRGALQNADIDPDVVEQTIRTQLDRDLPLGVAQGQQVQRIRLRRFVTDEQRSLGLYVDLALRASPEPGDFVAARGEVEDAQDFRPAGVPLAFASSPGLFSLLGPDAKSRQAEPNESGTGFRFPLRKDPLDPESEEIGRIKGISVGPELIAISGIPTGRMMVDVHGEYTDALGDPDFHLQLLFRPVRDQDGLIKWDLDVDVDLGLLATLFLIAAGIGLTLLFGPALGWGSTLMVGTIVGLAVLKGLIAEPLAAKLVEGHLDEESQASVLDALPFRLPAAQRRWDPFYVTQHQIDALLTDDVVIDQDGIAFQAATLALDKQPVPVDHVVIRDEDRVSGTVSGLRYRVSDFNRHTADFQALAPGTDRLPFSRTEPVAEPTLVSLDHAQIAERIDAHKLLAPITYTGERIYLVHGQIDALLVLSSRERAEQQQAVIDRFRRRMFDFITAEYGTDFRAQAIQQLTAELGRAPTEDEITQAVRARINSVVDGLMPGFTEQLLPGLLDAAVASTLRFDLAPEEMIELQQAGVLILDGKEIIVRENADGTKTPYYRDHPDGDKRDNLLSLRHYTPPYQPPPA
ncbi:MAG: hypothetical protein ACRDT4_23905 [Micromonosporaceae bacterium]